MSFGYTLVIALINSLQIWLSTEDLHKIRPIHSSHRMEEDRHHVPDSSMKDYQKVMPIGVVGIIFFSGVANDN